MIHIEQNQQLKDDPKLRVAVPTGDYNETDLIECYEDGSDASSSKFMYQAQYIALGSCVYQQSDEITEDQVAALLANKPIHEVINNRKLIDGKKPAAKYIGKVIGRKGLIGKRNLRGDVVIDETVPVVDEKPVKPIKPVKQQEVIPESNAQSTTTQQTSSIPQQSQSTTTPEIVQSASSTPPFDINTSTTTPSIVNTDPIETNISTTTSIDSSGSEVTTNTSTTTEAVPEPSPSNVENTAAVIESILNTNESTTTPSVVDEVVSYAKKRIVRKLRI